VRFEFRPPGVYFYTQMSTSVFFVASFVCAAMCAVLFYVYTNCLRFRFVCVCVCVWSPDVSVFSNWF